jgi:penicillin amidase
VTELPPGHYDVPGLEREVEIIIDAWGVPHIYAGTAGDAFLAQGFNAARDRLFQIDLWRRRGHGRLAEVLGPAYAGQDRASRLLLFRGDLEAEWAAYGPGARAVITAFTAGINAYVGWVRAHPEALPPEFTVYGYQPDHWQPQDVLAVRTHGLFYNAEQEVARAQVLRDLGPEVEELRQAREPADPLTVPDGLDLSLISDDVLATYRLAFSPVNFAGQAEPLDWRQAASGSNNWVIGAERSQTGRPILANDPHRAVTLPSLRYLAHLEAPGLSVIGAGEPGLPGISIGHNGQIAFGLTIWAADHEDLYVYQLDPADPSRYRYGDGWEPFRVVSEQVAVAGQDPQPVTLEFTRHGPVIHRDEARGFAVALRAVWLEPGMVPYLGSLEYLAARDGDEFLQALRHWGAPGVNQVWATPDGDFGWQASALIPRRPNWDGSLPVPGDGRYEWDGFTRAPGLPSSRRPAAGWLATANEMNLPPGYRNDELTITYDWYTYGRSERIVEWLGEQDPGGKAGIAESVRMQSDVRNVHALRILRLLAGVDPGRVAERAVLSRLLDWDGAERPGSFEALVFEIWLRRHFRPWLAVSHLRRQGLTAEQASAALRFLRRDESFGGDLRAELRMLGAVDWADAAQAGELATGADVTLSAALAEIADLLGPDRGTWTWGALHHSLLIHPALDGVPGIPAGWGRVGPAPRGGSGDTVGNAGYDASFRQTIGSTFRMVVDVGNWDATQVMNAPGQSGDPRSAHYGDLFSSWVAGDSFPLLYSRAAVEAHAETRIRLRPAAPPGSPPP